MGDSTPKLSTMIMLVLIVLPLAIHGVEGSLGTTLHDVKANDIQDAIKHGKPLDFDDCSITGEVVLRGFSVNAHFNDTVFQDGISASSTTFLGDAYFERAKFNNTANFQYAKFNGDAKFLDSKFNRGMATFADSTFNRPAIFQNSIFNRSANFDRSVFNRTASFRGTRFNNDSSFNDSEFNYYAYFTNAKFNAVYFNNAQFLKDATFDSTQFKGTTSFNDSLFKEDAFFAGAEFDGTLYLMRTKYNKLYIMWGSINDLAYDDAAYLSLMENFKKLGYLEDYDDFYYNYRLKHRTQNWSGKYHKMNTREEWIRKRIDVGLELFYGYGKKPLNPIGWSIGTILSFGLIWWIGGLRGYGDTNQKGVFKKYVLEKEDRSRDSRSKLYVLAEAMIFSAAVFLSGTKLFIDPPRQPKMQEMTRFQTKIVFTIERVLGALFSILFFLALGATIVR